MQASSSEYGAKLRRQFHPLRMQRWALSDLNPWLAWLAPAARVVRAKRAGVEPDNAVRKLEKTASTAISASLDYYRAMRDAMSEAAFFTTYGNVFSLYIADKREAERSKAERIAEPRELPFVRRRSRRSARAAIPRRSRASRACSRARASRCCCRGCR